MGKSKKQRVVVEAAPARRNLPDLYLILLCAIVFLSPLVAGRLFPIPNLAMQALIVVTAGVWAFQAYKRGSIDLPGGRIPLYASIFFGLLILSMITSVSRRDTMRELVNVGSYLLVFLMAVGLKNDRKKVLPVLGSLVLSGMLVGALGLKEYVLSGQSGWRVFSTFFNPDYLAGFMVLILPIALAWYLSKTSFGMTAISALAVLFTLGGLLLTGSRFGFLTAFGGIAVFLILAIRAGCIKRDQLVRMSPFILLAAVVFVMLGKPLANRMGSVQAVKSESHSGGFRIYTWKGTARMAAAHPILGTGLGTFDVAYPKYATVGYTSLAHNSYLQIAGEAGPLAVAALILLLGASSLPATLALMRRKVDAEPVGISFGSKLPKHQEEPAHDTSPEEFIWMPEPRLIMCGLIGGAAASMARNLVDSDWYVTAVGINFWAVLGIVVAFGYPDVRIVPIIQRRFAVVASVLGLALMSVFLMLAGELYMQSGNIAAMDGDPLGMVDGFRQAAAFDFLNAEPHRNLGNGYLMMARGMHDDSYAKQAEDEMQKAILLEPTSAKSYYQLGRIFEYYPKNDNAIQAYLSALEWDPNSPQTLIALAQRYEIDGQAEKALATYKRLAQVEESPYEQVKAVPELVEPIYIFARVALGKDFEKQGKVSEAREEYKRALDRIERYEAAAGMRNIMDTNGRTSEMESQVEDAKAEVLLRMGNEKH